MSGRYRTIVADPPWPYADGAFKRMAPTGYSANVRRDGARAVQGRAVKRSLPYDPMTLKEIRAVNVREMADPKGCRLFLWTTNRFVHAAFDVLDAWGFQYIQMLVWHKPNPVPFPIDVAPSSSEFILTGLTGSPGRLTVWPSSVVQQGVPKRHSQKPDVFNDLIEQCSPHRSAYEEAYGEIPAGMQLHHLCGIRQCVNPEHLAVMTPRQHNQIHSRRRKRVA